ncbi:MAG: 50S ribosomal protein L17 [Candidatus Nomurabacteria bacterium]|jgi:large subunit ribosomal protein L17|nr:50S ribosomal protein L17 [Candidatus Nomurabacteria bacterium]
MHRHGYRGRKFGRERDQRRALLRGLTISLIEHGAIKTTLPKAKELRPLAEKLITKARGGSLSERRAVIAALGNNVAIASRLVDVIAPQIGRDCGYLRIIKEAPRVGDNAPMATIEFVDELKFDAPAAKNIPAASISPDTAKAKPAKTADSAAKSDAKKPAAKAEPDAKKSAAKSAKGDK